MRVKNNRGAAVRFGVKVGDVVCWVQMRKIFLPRRRSEDGLGSLDAAAAAALSHPHTPATIIVLWPSHSRAWFIINGLPPPSANPLWGIEDGSFRTETGFDHATLRRAIEVSRPATEYYM
jgi:hypothetical protein